MHEPIDPVLLRGLMQPRLSRRSFLRTAGAGVAGISLSSLLAACGDEGPAEPSPAAGFDWSAQKKAGQLVFANWPLYMDRARIEDEVHRPSLERFQEETGITVDYLEIIEDYASFFAKLQPLLAADEALGYDLIMMGYPRWFPLMIALDYLIPLDHSFLPDFEGNAADRYKDPSYDPGNLHGIPYQGGITGIGYDPELTGREIISVTDLFDPAFEGRVGMFNDTEDLPNLTLLGMGIEPSESTPEDWQKAADLLREQRDAGIVRKYYGQGYIGDLQAGNVALSMAWAADIFISNNGGYPNLKFVIPEEGALLWTDYLCIPKGAAHPVDAITYMNFIYKPEIAAMMSDWIWSVSPVPAAQEILREQGSDVAKSPLVFPTTEMYEQLHSYRILAPDEQQVWDELFSSVVQGV